MRFVQIRLLPHAVLVAGCAQVNVNEVVLNAALFDHHVGYTAEKHSQRADALVSRSEFHPPRHLFVADFALVSRAGIMRARARTI
jgi:hypothetical protein